MKYFVSLSLIVLFSTPINAQSGRRGTKIVVPVSPPPAETTLPTSTKPTEAGAQVTAEPDQYYRCTEDGSLARLIDASEAEPKVFSSKDVDVKAAILSKPPPVYTKEARRNGVQGFVVLKLLLAADGQIDRIRIVKRLPAGLTENAIRAACKIKFKPATKNGEPVAQLVTVEYVFRLADSSIFGP